MGEKFMVTPAPTSPLDLLSRGRHPYFRNSGFVAQSCGAPDSLKLKWELVVGSQQKCPGALDIPSASRWGIIHL